MADKSIIAKANNAFGLNLFKVVHESSKGKNVFLSPFSLSTALAMTQLGARESTAVDMAKVLQWSGQDETKIHQLYESYISLVQKPSAEFQLSTANRIFIQQDFSVLAEFKDKTKTLYHAEAVSANFKDKADAERQNINTWVSEQTQEKIKDLLAPGILNSDTRMVLVNAIYFKGKWDTPFKDRDTFTSPFKVAPGQTINVKMMSATSIYPVIKDSDLQCTAIEIPYKGKSLGMVIILPDEDFGLETLLGKLNPDKLGGLLTKLSDPQIVDQVQLLLPRFEMTSSFGLKSTLSALGMAKAFDMSKADFSGMTKQEDLFLSEVIHKAFVQVNEEGTEAAAATAMLMMPGCAMPRPKPIVRVDHPFLFFIKDRRAGGNVLFMGQMVDPSA